MLGKLIINGLDFSGLVARGGISQSPDSRVSREVTTLDGTLHRAVIYKKAYNISFVEMPETRLMDISNTITQPSTVQILDNQAGLITRQFYVDGPQYTQQIVEAGTTYITDASISLTEV